jgi:serine/threonine-protein kinase
MSPEVNEMILHYRLVAKLGEGGMGVVWKAVDTTLDREVAIKILPAEFSADPERLARFEREAKVVASLNHPNIASVFSVHESVTSTGSLRFLVMELVHGEVSRHGARPRRGPRDRFEARSPVAERFTADRAPGRRSTRGGA